MLGNKISKVWQLTTSISHATHIYWDEKKNDTSEINHKNAFAKWFDEFDGLRRLMNDAVSAKLEEMTQKTNNDEQKEKGKDVDENDNEEAEETSLNFLKMIADCLGLNHLKLNNKRINEEYMCCLGDSQSLGKKKMKEIKCSIYDTFASKMIENYYQTMHRDNGNNNENMTDDEIISNPTPCDDDDDDDCKNNDSDPDTTTSSSEEDMIDFQTCLDYFLNDNNTKNTTKHLDGFIMNSLYLRTIVDGIKCRSNIDALLDFNFGPANEFQLNKSELIILLLEISEESIHKKILSSAIEQRIPIPILYPMVQAITTRTATTSKINIDNKISVTADCYMRDILHLTSQSKVISMNE